MSEISSRLPDGLRAYARSQDFTPDTLPVKLRAAHTTKAGTWGLIHVLEGEIVFRLDPPYRGEQHVSVGDNVVIEPQVPHHVAFIEPGQFFIEFYRAAR